MYRKQKRRIDSVFKKKPVYEYFHSGTKVLINYTRKPKPSQY